MTVPVKQLALMASYIEPLAFYFAVFLPSLPYTLFMIVFVGWVLAVLQSIIAAPLWAVMHMTPDRTFVAPRPRVTCFCFRCSPALRWLFWGCLPRCWCQTR